MAKISLNINFNLNQPITLVFSHYFPHLNLQFVPNILYLRIIIITIRNKFEMLHKVLAALIFSPLLTGPVYL